MFDFIVFPLACFCFFVVLPSIQLKCLFRETATGRIVWFTPKNSERPPIELASGDVVAASFSIFSCVWLVAFGLLAWFDPMERSLADPFGWYNIHQASDSPTTALAALSGTALVFTLVIAPIVTIAANYLKPSLRSIPAMMPWLVVSVYVGWSLLHPLITTQKNG
ncbi:MAG: hypothetical protein F9B45_31525 [Phycisphaera sp. RhM]|nr:hypothetical protein [Phycisphaera sp. RhM]